MLSNGEKCEKPKQIPQQLWDFFDSEEGLSVFQLIRAIFIKQVVHPFDDLEWTFRLLHKFDAYDLVKFYRDHQGLSVDALLQYDAYAIRDFACHDKGLKFHLWLLEHHLSMPEKLVHDNWCYIYTFCSESGIEYLNRKILTLDEDDQQFELNRLVSLDNVKLQTDIQSVLSDSVVSKEEACGLGTFNDRFVTFRKKLEENITKNSKDSLKVNIGREKHVVGDICMDVYTAKGERYSFDADSSVPHSLTMFSRESHKQKAANPLLIDDGINKSIQLRK